MRARDLTSLHRRRRTTCSSSAAASTGSPSRTRQRAAACAPRSSRRATSAAATSFNHQKTAHGGLRSLQSARLERARESIRERRALARIAPWLLRPLPFLVGTYRSLTRNRLALRAAFKLDAWLGRRRNDGVEPELHLPAAAAGLEGRDAAALSGHHGRTD